MAKALYGFLGEPRASMLLKQVAELQARVRDLERALEAGPPSTMALNGLGLTRLAVGDTAGAAAAFRKSLQLDPKQPEIARTLAEMRRRG